MCWLVGNIKHQRWSLPGDCRHLLRNVGDGPVTVRECPAGEAGVEKGTSYLMFIILFIFTLAVAVLSRLSWT